MIKNKQYLKEKAPARWRFLICLALFSALATTHAQAQFTALEKIELLNMGGSYRLVITCDDDLRYVDQFDETQNLLSLYLRNVQVGLSKMDYVFDGKLVSHIKVVQWRKTPPVARIEVFLLPGVEYKIKTSIDGLLLVDILMRPVATGENRHSSGEQPYSQVASPLSEIQNGSVGEIFRGASGDIFLKPRSGGASGESGMAARLQSKARITLDVKAAPISNVLRLLAKQSKLNIVASNDVSGDVSVSLIDVTIKQALDMVVKANGMDYAVSGDVILVKPRDKFDALELETRIYRLKYIDASNLKVAVEQILSPNAKVQVFYRNFRQVEEVGKQEGQGKRSSTLIVTDRPVNIQRLNALVAALDVPKPQIMIEAKLIEVSPENEQKIGIDWDKTINAQIFQEVILPSGQPEQLAAEVPLTGGSVSWGTLTADRYNAVLNFLSSKTNSKLISNPRVMAMDNEEALISVGTTFPIAKITRGVGGQGDVVSFEYRDIDISLRVRAHIGGDNTITMYVNPVVEEVIGQVVAAGNIAPITSKRTVETVVNLKNNETMVIGGLIQEKAVDIEQKVWLLGDIPLIGNFFRNKEKSKKQTDLLIFITPRVVGTF